MFKVYKDLILRLMSSIGKITYNVFYECFKINNNHE